MNGRDSVICPKCKKHFSEGFNFCPWCGSKKAEFKICPNCEYKTYDEEFMFCPECGKKLINEKQYEALEEIRIEELKRLRRKNEFIKKEEREREETKENKKLNLFLYLNSTNIGTNAKRKIRKLIESGEITKKSQIDAYKSNLTSENFSSYPRSYIYRDDYSQDYQYWKDLYH